MKSDGLRYTLRLKVCPNFDRLKFSKFHYQMVFKSGERPAVPADGLTWILCVSLSGCGQKFSSSQF